MHEGIAFGFCGLIIFIMTLFIIDSYHIKYLRCTLTNHIKEYRLHTVKRDYNTLIAIEFCYCRRCGAFLGSQVHERAETIRTKTRELSASGVIDVPRDDMLFNNSGFVRRA